MKNKKQKTKYIMNWGLDIAEEYMLKKFSKLYRQGWRIESMTAFGFKFVKSQPQNKIFAFDCQSNIKDKKEYEDIFKSAGWDFVCSCGEWCIFSADEGTCEIYTDKTELNNNINLRFKAVMLTWILALIVYAAMWLILGLTEVSGILRSVCITVMLPSAMLLGGCTPWIIGLINKKRKMR